MAYKIIIQEYGDGSKFIFDVEDMKEIKEKVFGTFEKLSNAVKTRKLLIEQEWANNDHVGMKHFQSIYIKEVK